jgi:hypothetical protein
MKQQMTTTSKKTSYDDKQDGRFEFFLYRRTPDGRWGISNY